MKFYRDSIELKTQKNFQYINITDRVQDIVNKSKIKDGIVFVNAAHNTATVILQEDDSSIHEDTKEIIEELVPLNRKYRHNYEGVINAASHIKNQLLGNSNLAIPVKDGRLFLGTWQQVFLLELLEPRRREVTVTVIGE
ncbi:MAG: secondary thiamine-phosphate synthase enzyme YjbQ [Candidatus Aenigmarchaeota archaeon]|nr:secondary thiamine-phosphate synthase enzyme YjbQ [Candidatus Aenigmarchaeota archaeon]